MIARAQGEENDGWQYRSGRRRMGNPAMSRAGPLLQLDSVRAGYTASQVLDGVSLEVDQGEVVCLLGRNGAGKTTTIRAICGLLAPTGGTIAFEGRPIAGKSPVDIVNLGLSVVPEGRKVFQSLSVEENLLVGAYPHRKGLVPSADMDEVFSLFPRLAERRRQAAGTLSGGEQQMLAMGRAMMSRPRLLLLDEPSMGLAPLLIDQVFDTINLLAERGMTVLLVEQNAAAALDLADRCYVLERGRIVVSGPSAELERSENIRKAYLGT